MLNLMKEIMLEVTTHKAVTESYLRNKLMTNEDLAQLADIKAAAIKLANNNKINLMTDSDGAYILTEIPKEWH